MNENATDTIRQFHYQIDITEICPPVSVQASSDVCEAVRFKPDITLVDNCRHATQHPAISR